MAENTNDPDLDQLIAELHAKKEYRPVGVALMNNPSGKYLMIRSPYAPAHYWSFPQGGIRPNETLQNCLKRELNTELGISLDTDLEGIQYNFHNKATDFKPSRTNRRSFTRGKHYFFNLARYSGDYNLVLKVDEVAEAEWVDYAEMLERIQRVRPEKALLLLKVLSKAQGLFPYMFHAGSEIV